MAVPEVKGSSKRTERAQQTLRRIVAAAHCLFVEQGYGVTVMPEIASRAGVAASAADPDIASVWSFDVDPRHTVQSAAAQALIGKPGARPGLTAELVADILFGLLSPQLHQLFVRDRAWSSEAYERWVHDTLQAQLCGDAVDDGT